MEGSTSPTASPWPSAPTPNTTPPLPKQGRASAKPTTSCARSSMGPRERRPHAYHKPSIACAVIVNMSWSSSGRPPAARHPDEVERALVAWPYLRFLLVVVKLVAAMTSSPPATGGGRHRHRRWDEHLGGHGRRRTCRRPGPRAETTECLVEPSPKVITTLFVALGWLWLAMVGTERSERARRASSSWAARRPSSRACLVEPWHHPRRRSRARPCGLAVPRGRRGGAA